MFWKPLYTVLNILLHILAYIVFVKFIVELVTSKPTLIVSGSLGFLLLSFFTIQQNTFFPFLVPVDLLTLVYMILLFFLVLQLLSKLVFEIVSN